MRALLKSLQCIIVGILSLPMMQVFAQENPVLENTTVQVPGFISYNNQGQIFVPISGVNEIEKLIKENDSLSDSIKFVVIIPVFATGAKNNISYDQVYGKAARQGIRPCEEWVAAKIAKYNLPIRDKVYILTDVYIALDKDEKPRKKFTVPFIGPKNGGLELGEENMGTLESFELVAEISNTGEMETLYDVKYKWDSFPSENSRIMVLMSKERMMR